VHGVLFKGHNKNELCSNIEDPAEIPVDNKRQFYIFTSK